MANPEERPDDRPELPTRVPFAGPHPGTVERDWKSPLSRPPAPAQARPHTSLSRATGIPRQRGGAGPGSAVAEKAPASSATTAEPAEVVRPLRSRVLPAAVAAAILVAGAMWWSRDRPAPASEQAAPVPTAAPTMRITAPGAAASAAAGVGGDTVPTKPASDTGSKATGDPASSGGSKPNAGQTKPAPKANPTGGAANTSGRNLALNARTTASSIERGTWAAANAVDGDSATRWSSQFSDPQWFMVDLGKRWEISEILLHWENAHATAYRVEVSTDGKKWKQVYSTTDGQGGDVTVPVPKIPTQLVRMYGTKRSTDYGYSLLDVEVR